ncbi:hypothetical protein [uncultured Faecalicoccus sp.]|uniref:hypothetical protein n=1 Tax=uncultured Faecalicoccus sp. TaxID=1971760 RepID=UPI0025CCD07F|nr:hypothetical protein [uncultured Faecalicoccus sp.]
MAYFIVFFVLILVLIALFQFLAPILLPLLFLWAVYYVIKSFRKPDSDHDSFYSEESYSPRGPKHGAIDVEYTEREDDDHDS